MIGTTASAKQRAGRLSAKCCSSLSALAPQQGSIQLLCITTHTAIQQASPVSSGHSLATCKTAQLSSLPPG